MEGMSTREITLPVVAIGGITLADIPDILATGVNGVAISGAIVHSASPEEATRQFLQILRQTKEHL
jgi:thiamine-phosphate pyrophosphorylase